MSVTSPAELLDLKVERPVAGGAMLAHHDGRVVLVSGAIPGERVHARLDRARKDVIHATVMDVLEPDADRRPVEGDPACGGQVYRHVAYPRQLVLKSEVIRDALMRLGRVVDPTHVPVLGSPEQGYRMRARLHVGDAAVGFLREGTHTICDAVQTGQLQPETGRVVAEVGRRLTETDRAAIVHIDLVENIAADQRVIHYHLRRRLPPDIVAGWSTRTKVTGVTTTTSDDPRIDTVAGVGTVADSVAVLTEDATSAPGELVRHAPSFFQANRFLLPQLVAAVRRHITEGPVIDLYAGVGLFSVCLADGGVVPVTAVERDRYSAADLNMNAVARHGQIHAVRSSVERYLRRRTAPVEGTVLLDPPRAGLGRDVIDRLTALRTRRVVYVSCDVATFARDLRRFVESGYSLTHLEAFDLFPATAHVELLATLEA